MADDIDRATERYQYEFDMKMRLRQAISEQPSERFCVECETEIPEKRRDIGGVKRCIDCQNALEGRR